MGLFKNAHGCFFVCFLFFSFQELITSCTPFGDLFLSHNNISQATSHLLVHHLFRGCQVIGGFIPSLFHQLAVPWTVGKAGLHASFPTRFPSPQFWHRLSTLLFPTDLHEGTVQFWTHPSSTQTPSVAPQCLTIEIVSSSLPGIQSSLTKCCSNPA